MSYLNRRIKEFYNALKENNGKNSYVILKSLFEYKFDVKAKLRDFIGDYAITLLLSDAKDFAKKGEVALATKWLDFASGVIYHYGINGYQKLKGIIDKFEDESLKVIFTMNAWTMPISKYEKIAETIKKLDKIEFTLALTYLQTSIKERYRNVDTFNDKAIDHIKRIYDQNEILAKAFIQNHYELSNNKKIDEIVDDIIDNSKFDERISYEIINSAHKLYEISKDDDIKKTLSYARKINEISQNEEMKESLEDIVNYDAKPLGNHYLRAITEVYVNDNSLRISFNLSEYAKEIYEDVEKMINHDLDKEIINLYLEELPHIEKTIVKKDALINILIGLKDKSYAQDFFKTILSPDYYLGKGLNIYREQFQEMSQKSTNQEQSLKNHKIKNTKEHQNIRDKTSK